MIRFSSRRTDGVLSGYRRSIIPAESTGDGGFVKPSGTPTWDTGHSLYSGLRGDWLFNEGSGIVVNDYGPNNYDLELQGGTTRVSTSEGAAVRFDGVDGLAVVSNVLGITTAATMWIRFEPLTLPQSAVLLKLGGPDGMGLGIGDVDVDTNGSNIAALLEAAYHIPTTREITLRTRNIAMSGASIYDGSYPVEASGGTNTPTTQFIVGGVGGGRFSYSIVQRVIVWNRELTYAELEALEANPYAGYL
jgi:hypothetical protein